MQERYLGDSHDFIKFALLRHLHKECGVRIGVNWHLTRPEDVDATDNNDGQKRHHLKGGGWEDLDSDLLKRIKRFEDPEKQRLQNIKRWKILPENTIYFSQPVPVDKRASWHERAQTALKDADLVFFDPDNGFEVKSMTGKRSPKYALCCEAADYLSCGKIVVAIQFAGRGCSVEEQAKKIRRQLKKRSGAKYALPVIRGRAAPNVLFFTLAPAGCAKEFKTALESFACRSPKIRGRRVIELIK